MTEAILIVSGLVFGAICLGVGYLLAKKAKVEKQVRAELDRLSLRQVTYRQRGERQTIE